MCVFVKPLLVALTVLFVTKTNQQTVDPNYIKLLDGALQQCADENGVDLSTIAKVWQKQEQPDDPNMKCIFKCICTKLGLIDANGDVVDDGLEKFCVNYFNSTENTTVMTKCKNIKDPDLCAAAYTLVECVLSLT